MAQPWPPQVPSARWFFWILAKSLSSAAATRFLPASSGIWSLTSGNSTAADEGVDIRPQLALHAGAAGGRDVERILVRFLDLAADELDGMQHVLGILALGGRVAGADQRQGGHAGVGHAGHVLHLAAAAHVGRLLALAPASPFQLMLDEPFHPPFDVLRKWLGGDRLRLLCLGFVCRGRRVCRRLFLGRRHDGRRQTAHYRHNTRKNHLFEHNCLILS